MPPRCRVTFYRSLLIDSALPLIAAERALAWLLERNVLPEDLGPSVKVEIIRTVEQSIQLDSILHQGRARRTRVA